ncbi:IscS subfamily cysteine desulfurase [Halobacillus kuroshimensis]|uniref:IscS subfamily cysteine desulfurase n=1 Tax=Halobacillus kuroshimensis TaxID=302481 RepID=UPI0003F810ED|nr:IscS subfamily cysteine desulfurase [Halobacillus kuroshimensis]
MNRYFDYAATSPMDPEALEAYVHAATHYYGNAESLHDAGTKASSLLEHCRKKLGELLHVPYEGIAFTSGGTESNELAVSALIKALNSQHLVISGGEHSSIHNLAERMKGQGIQVTIIPLHPNGQVDLTKLEKALYNGPAVVALHHVNGEIGSIQPVEEAVHTARKYGSLLHCDCVQSFGKISLSTIGSIVDSLSVSSHKVSGPKGTGAVYIRPDLSFQPLTPDVTHEKGVRPGTVDVPGAAGFVTAAEKAVKHLPARAAYHQHLKTSFLEELTPGRWQLAGETEHQPVPIIGLMLDHHQGQWMMLEGSRRGYFFSTGSACRVHTQQASYTLSAMGVKEEDAKSFIRISFSHHHSKTDILDLAHHLNLYLPREDD